MVALSIPFSDIFFAKPIIQLIYYRRAFFVRAIFSYIHVIRVRCHLLMSVNLQQTLSDVAVILIPPLTDLQPLHISTNFLFTTSPDNTTTTTTASEAAAAVNTTPSMDKGNPERITSAQSTEDPSASPLQDKSTSDAISVAVAAAKKEMEAAYTKTLGEIKAANMQGLKQAAQNQVKSLNATVAAMKSHAEKEKADALSAAEKRHAQAMEVALDSLSKEHESALVLLRERAGTDVLEQDSTSEETRMRYALEINSIKTLAASELERVTGELDSLRSRYEIEVDKIRSDALITARFDTDALRARLVALAAIHETEIENVRSTAMSLMEEAVSKHRHETDGLQSAIARARYAVAGANVAIRVSNARAEALELKAAKDTATLLSENYQLEAVVERIIDVVASAIESYAVTRVVQSLLDLSPLERASSCLVSADTAESKTEAIDTLMALITPSFGGAGSQCISGIIHAVVDASGLHADRLLALIEGSIWSRIKEERARVSAINDFLVGQRGMAIENENSLVRGTNGPASSNGSGSSSPSDIEFGFDEVSRSRSSSDFSDPGGRSHPGANPRVTVPDTVDWIKDAIVIAYSPPPSPPRSPYPTTGKRTGRPDIRVTETNPKTPEKKTLGSTAMTALASIPESVTLPLRADSDKVGRRSLSNLIIRSGTGGSSNAKWRSGSES